MSRFPFRTDWYARGLVYGLGLLPTLAYAEADDETFAVRFGPWYTLRAPLDAIDTADVSRDPPAMAPSIDVRATDGHTALTLRTGRGPLTRVRFTERVEGRWLLGPPRFTPRFAPIVIGQPHGIDELLISVERAGELADRLRG